MEKLNIDELKNIKTDIRSSEKSKIGSKDSNIRVLKAIITGNGEDLNYAYEDVKANTRVAISGNDFNGYSKIENKLDDPTYEKNSEFYPNGNLKSTGSRYIRKEGEEPNGMTRNIGTWYRYDEKENIVDTIEYDEAGVLFTLKDLNAFLKKNKINASSIVLRPKTTINKEKIHEAAWLISFSETPSTITKMVLDAGNGEVIKRSEPQRIIK